MNITILRNGQNYGPYTLDQVKQYVGNGSLSEGDLAWYEGCMDWLPLRDIITPVTTPPPPPRSASSPISQSIEPTVPSSVEPSNIHSSQPTKTIYSSEATKPILESSVNESGDNQLKKMRIIGAIVGMIVLIGIVILCSLNSQHVADSSPHLQSSSVNPNDSLATSSSVNQSQLPYAATEVKFDANSSNSDIYNKLKDKIVFALRYFPPSQNLRRDLVGWTCVASGYLKPDDNSGGISIKQVAFEAASLSFNYNIIKNDDGRGNTTTTSSLVCTCDDNSSDDGPVFVNTGSLETRPQQGSFGNYLHFVVVENPLLDSIGSSVEIADATKVIPTTESDLRGYDAGGHASDMVWVDYTYPKQADKSEWGNFVPRNGDAGKVVAIGIRVGGFEINNPPFVVYTYCVAIDTPVKTYYVNVVASGLTVKSPPPKTLNATDSTTSTVTPESPVVSPPPAQTDSSAAASPSNGSPSPSANDSSPNDKAKGTASTTISPTTTVDSTTTSNSSQPEAVQNASPQLVSQGAKLVGVYRKRFNKNAVVITLFDDNTYTCDDPNDSNKKVYGTYSVSLGHIDFNNVVGQKLGSVTGDLSTGFVLKGDSEVYEKDGSNNDAPAVVLTKSDTNGSSDNSASGNDSPVVGTYNAHDRLGHDSKLIIKSDGTYVTVVPQLRGDEVSGTWEWDKMNGNLILHVKGSRDVSLRINTDGSLNLNGANLPKAN